MIKLAQEQNTRNPFEVFKNTVCHYVKDMGDLDFITAILESDEICKLYKKGWYPETLYLLAMLDYLSRINDIPICTRYNDLRKSKLERPVYPVGVLLYSEVLHSDEPLRIAEETAIPEFRQFNLIESDVRNVV